MLASTITMPTEAEELWISMVKMVPVMMPSKGLPAMLTMKSLAIEIPQGYDCRGHHVQADKEETKADDNMAPSFHHPASTD
jgi:hypothetical protein